MKHNIKNEKLITKWKINRMQGLRGNTQTRCKAPRPTWSLLSPSLHWLKLFSCEYTLDIPEMSRTSEEAKELIRWALQTRIRIITILSSDDHYIVIKWSARQLIRWLPQTQVCNNLTLVIATNIRIQDVIWWSCDINCQAYILPKSSLF